MRPRAAGRGAPIHDSPPDTITNSPPDTIVRDAGRRQAVGGRHAGSWGDGGVAEGPAGAGGRVVARAHDVSESGRAGRAARVGAARHRARRLGQERRHGRGRRPGVAARRVGVGGQGMGALGPCRRRGPVERAIGRRRRRDPDRRSHGAVTGRRGTAAGGWNLSRHRDLGREHRDSDAAPHRRRAVAGRLAPRRRGRRYRPAAGLRPGHRAGALGRSGDLGRGALPRWTPHRTARAIDQHPGRRRDARPFDIAGGRVRPRLPPVLWRDLGHPDWRAEAGVGLCGARRWRRVRSGR